MLRRLDPDRLENILLAFFRPRNGGRSTTWLEKFLPGLFPRKEE
jgi:hypothetical protein